MAEIRGLTPNQVKDRVRAGQVNEVSERTSRSVGEIICANVFTRFNALLGTLFALILIVGSGRDALFGGVLAANALIGIVQELRAKRMLDRLVVLIRPKARVIRSGLTEDIPTAAVVLDDIVDVGPGDQIVADGIVLESEGLEVDESLISGEAVPLAKPPGAALLSGSFVAAGSGRYRATAVGASAYAHRLAAAARRYTPAHSDLQVGINKLLRGITWGLAILIPLLFASQLDVHDTVSGAVQSTVAGVVPMVPEGLVLLTSLALATAVTRLGRRHVLVQELPAVETLARVDVVCVDKTGTLTEADLSVEGIELVADCNDTEAALAALAAADPHPNATLRAIATQYSHQMGWRLLRHVPFSATRKWSAASFDKHGTWILGAPDILLVDAPGREPLRARALSHAIAGKRVLLLGRLAGECIREDRLPDLLRPVALVILIERVRPDASETLRYLAAQGIALKVISGDHPNTVATVLRRAGLEKADKALDARELPGDLRALAATVGDHDVYGRASPQNKEAIVKALQARGRVVAMIGDGINDVLALKQADIGIAIGSGSAVTRSVAQLVLLDGRFASLPPVLNEGRRVIGNVERLAVLFITKTIYALLLALAVGVADLAFPFLPRHLTLVGALTIGVPAFFLSLAPNAAKAQRGFLRRVLRFALPAGLIAFAATFCAYLFAHMILDVGLETARTTATLVLIFVGLWILTILSRPLTPLRGLLIGLMAVAFAGVELLPDLRAFFALAPLSVSMLATTLVAASIAGLGLELAARSVGGAQAGWLGRLISLLLDPRRRPDRSLVILGVTLAASTLLFFGVLEDVVSGDPLVRADAALFNLLQSVRSERLDQWMVAITELADVTVTIAVSTVALAWLATRKAWRAIAYGIAAVASTAIFTLAFKAELGLARPMALYGGWDAFAFPSSHASVTAALYGFLAMLIVRETSPRWHRWIIGGVSVFVVVIALSRLYLGAHWLSDIVAGLAFGVGWVALLAIAYLRRSQPAIRATPFLLITGFTLLLVGIIHIGLQHSVDMDRYAVRETVRSMPLADWWQGRWTELPARRIDLAGGLDEPFTVQWVGNLDALKTTLSANGWHPPVPWSQKAGFTWISKSERAIIDFPVLPQLHNGRTTTLLLVHTSRDGLDATRLVLRIWRSGIELHDRNGDRWPLWIATTVEERIDRFLGILTVIRATSNMEAVRHLVPTAFPLSHVVQRREAGAEGNGSVLLVLDAAVPSP